MHLPLAKAEPVSNSGSDSVITYLKRGKKKTQHLGKTSSSEKREE